jgi:hypothetical protein
MNDDSPHSPILSPRRLKLREVAANSPRLSHQQLLKAGSRNRLSGFAMIALQVKLEAGAAGRPRQMKTLTIAVAMLALIAMPAYAQVGGRHTAGDEKKDEPVKKIDEKAYKAALERIPEPKEKYDPWGVARPAEPAKKPK